MSIVAFWTRTDADQLTSSAAIRVDARIAPPYAHALALESWRRNLLDNALGSGLDLWYEAQNDFLLCLVHAGRGVWRSSLQALRSFVENSTSAVFFSEHPVEARRFESGDFRLTWSESKKYFASYPYSTPAAFRDPLWRSLDHEYAELSKAVHGSTRSFRMTAANAFPVLSSSDPALIGAWKTRVNHSARAVHLLLLQHFQDQLVGARLPALREEVARALSAAERTKIRTSLGIVLRP